jgi:tetratricopeptide (TPR) repeat protein
LLPLIEERPDVLEYRGRLMTCYHATKQKELLLATLKAADKYFHEKDRWQQNVIAFLASACLGTELWAESVAYFTEVIPLHQRSAPRRGVGDGTLAEYYSQLGLAYSGLGKTAEAIDAVSGAIVAWPAAHQERTRHLQRLQQVMSGAADLDVYVQQLDKKESAAGQGSPVLRKALGKAYQSKEQFAKALAQFKVAVEMQPEDAETHQEMIACYDRMKDIEGAARQLYDATQLSRRNTHLYEQMGIRLEQLNRSAEAERAYTSMVEMQANETESHSKLAEIRARQSRWDEAAAHWQRVAVLRSLEPTGLLELAKVQIHLKQWGKASETVRQLEKKVWPSRFSRVQEETAALRVKVEEGRKQP